MILAFPGISPTLTEIVGAVNVVTGCRDKPVGILISQSREDPVRASLETLAEVSFRRMHLFLLVLAIYRQNERFR